MCTPRRFQPKTFKHSGVGTANHVDEAHRATPNTGQRVRRGGTTAPPLAGWAPKASAEAERRAAGSADGDAEVEATHDNEEKRTWKVRTQVEVEAEADREARARAKVQAGLKAQLEAGKRVAQPSPRPTQNPTTQPTPVAGALSDPSAGAVDPEPKAEAAPKPNRQQLKAAQKLLAEADRKRPPGYAVQASLPDAVVEVTVRIRGGQFLLRPDDDLNSVAAGILGRAQKFTGVRIGAVNVMSNHLSLLVAVKSPEQLAAFTNRAMGQLADRVGRLRGMRMRIWGRRNRSIVVDPNTADVTARLKYCMANGTKENLVAHPSQWPGLNSARVFVLGELMKGKWTDYSAWGQAKRRDPDAPESAFQTEYEVVHSKMPGLDHLSDEDYQALMCRLCDEASNEAKATRQSDGLPEPGDPQRLTKIPFEHFPDEVSVSPAPAVHAHDPERQRQYRAEVKAYREHLRAVRQGLADFLSSNGLDLAGEGIPPTGWRPVDPSMVVPPVRIELTQAASS